MKKDMIYDSIEQYGYNRDFLKKYTKVIELKNWKFGNFNCSGMAGKSNDKHCRRGLWIQLRMD